MGKPVKTNVLRYLTANHIPYETKEYEVNDENFDGKLVAAKTGLDAAMIYKTLVLCDDKNGHLVCVIPVSQELDLKLVARSTGHKSVAMLPQKELLPLTGYIRGGCSPIGMKKQFPTFIDNQAKELQTVSVSAGVRGCQVILSVEDLRNACRGEFADLAVKE